MKVSVASDVSIETISKQMHDNAFNGSDIAKLLQMRILTL